MYLFQRILTLTNYRDFSTFYRDIIEAAKEDPELAELLTTSGNNPAKVESRLRSEMDALHAKITGKFGSGEEAPPEVTFRALDPFEMWIWVELYTSPSASELEMTQEVINSWFMLGRLGAYNSSNLQVLYSSSGAGLDLEYDMAEATSGGMTSTMHDMGAVESNGPWLRFWVDMGTSDELAIDILINALMTFSREHVGVRQIVIGGENDDWSVPERAMRSEVAIDPYLN
jgi:hypothetical protein